MEQKNIQESQETAVKENTEYIVEDLNQLRLTQNYSEMAGLKKAILTAPVRKPLNQDFVRVHPDEDYCLHTAVLEMKEDRETYLVERSLWSMIPREIIPKILLTAINRQGVLFIWPIRLPSADGRIDAWNRAALQAAELAKGRWVRLISNISLGSYDVYVGPEDIPDPEWPELSFQEILSIAFKDHFIKDLDHPILKRLRGER